jgi:glycosyltransferase involved in cell wall biosynthesis
MPPLKVMHLITRLDWGGSAQNTILTVLGHNRARFEPVVATGPASLGQGNSLTDAQGGRKAIEANRKTLEAEKIRFHVIPSLHRALSPWKDLHTLAALIALCRSERPTIVHTHTSKAGILGRLAGWAAGVPIVVHTPHGHVFYGHFGRVLSWLFLRLERLWARRTTWLIALTESERAEHLERGVGDARHFSVIPSGIDLEAFWNVPEGVGPRPAGFPDGAGSTIIGSVGWLTPIKGHAVLIEALAQLQSAHPGLHAVIVGSGPLSEELTALARGLGLSEKIHLLGMRQDIPGCVAAMDVFVLPSLNEGMGRALVEAMAAGRPVVASRVGGVPAVVQDRHNGLLVPAGNPGALAAAIGELLRRPDWARELGSAARKAIDIRFGTRAMVRGVEAVYDAALAERRMR